MDTIQLYNQDHAEIIYNSALRTIVLTWKGFANEESYRETVTTAYQAILKYEAIGWISDQTLARAVPKSGSDWVKTTMVPKMAEAGIKAAAFITSKDTFNQIYAKGLEKVILNQSTALRYFSDKEEASAWLQEELTIVQ
ncbi:STAS/SEC14 domain-containing protein [Algivirga pacifica]|uniref:STAS/SEC14 domain-containing protein n=1 Tax=Algivirga pacifica TaxID=1162670 RepID=A0ABP9DAT9_9BACT